MSAAHGGVEVSTSPQSSIDSVWCSSNVVDIRDGVLVAILVLVICCILHMHDWQNLHASSLFSALVSGYIAVASHNYP